ncbi:hypothetical protein ENBRE01_1445 [Enteropsectra breve]|nr:hypothetical protein ENBRE01_1445 [Enteropsectra breve]
MSNKRILNQLEDDNEHLHEVHSNGLPLANILKTLCFFLGTERLQKGLDLLVTNKDWNAYECSIKMYLIENELGSRKRTSEKEIFIKLESEWDLLHRKRTTSNTVTWEQAEEKLKMVCEMYRESRYTDLPKPRDFTTYEQWWQSFAGRIALQRIPKSEMTSNLEQIRTHIQVKAH